MTLTHTWLPASKPDAEDLLQIVKAEGSHLITLDGRVIYDAISSWWCKPLGHRHPLVIKSITEQLKHFGHHISVAASNQIIEELSTRLVNIFSQMDKVMYASDGSSAIEMAMKLSYKTRVLNNQKERNKFIALNGAYHGETIFTLAACGIESYKTTYANLLTENYFIEDIPYVNSRFDPLWLECNFAADKLDKFFAQIAGQTTALIIEPVVQGAAGIKIISRDFLIKLINLAKKYAIHIISDEIMVGLGRLGCYSVTKDILHYEPEFVCFGKNLTAGSIPMSAVVINKSITDVFRQHQRLFAHSHTHSCNVLAASVALNYLKFLDNSPLLNNVILIEPKFLELMQKFATKFEFITNPRAIGAIAACELRLDKSILNSIFKIGVQHGIYLRLIGNTLYILPPLYNLSHDLFEIERKLNAVLTSININQPKAFLIQA